MLHYLSRNFVATQVVREIARCIMSRNLIVATTIAGSRIRFEFLQRLRERIFKALHSVTSLLQLVSPTIRLPIGF